MRRQHASMELRGLAPAGVVAAATDAAGAAAAAAQLFDTSGADSSDPEAAMGSGGSSANRKKSRKRRRGPPTGPTFRRFTRQLAIAAAASMAFALLLVFAARWMNALGGSGSTAAMAAATAAGSSAAALLQAAAADPGSTLVEFGAPGVMLPCRDAFDLSLPERAEEAALLELLPPGIPAGGRAAADAAVAQPTLAQVLDLFGQDGSGGAAVKANELQSALQQQEAEMQRAKDAAREAALGRDRPGEWEQLPGAAASRPRGLLLDSGSSAVQQALGGSGPAHAEGTAASAVRLLVGVVSACCSETAAVRRAAVRETWGRAVQEVRGHTARSVCVCLSVPRLRSPTELTSLLPPLHCNPYAASQHPGAELRFFLAQPPSAAVAAALLPAIAGEVAAHGDIVVLRGADTYKNLPNKTLRLLRFAVAAPAGKNCPLVMRGRAAKSRQPDTWQPAPRSLPPLPPPPVAAYTHVLKTDDDCFLRLPQASGVSQHACSCGAWACAVPGCCRRPALQPCLILLLLSLPAGAGCFERPPGQRRDPHRQPLPGAARHAAAAAGDGRPRRRGAAPYRRHKSVEHESVCRGSREQHDRRTAPL